MNTPINSSILSQIQSKTHTRVASRSSIEEKFDSRNNLLELEKITEEMPMTSREESDTMIVRETDEKQFSFKPQISSEKRGETINLPKLNIKSVLPQSLP